MENLNAEQIIKALECCIKTQCENCCNLGSWHEQWNCMTDLMKKALSLIKQLTDEIADLKEDKELYSVFCEDYKKQVKKLTEENERLREDNEIKSQKRVSTFEIVNAYERARADTVRKMRTALIANLSPYSNYTTAEVCDLIDQIAKEMVEGTGNG